MSAPSAGDIAPLKVIETPDGPVSQATIETLEQIVSEDARAAQQLDSQVAQLRGHVSANQARIGWLLTRHQGELVSSISPARFEVVLGLEALVSNLKQGITQLEQQPHGGLGGLIRGIRDKHEVDSLQAKLRSALSELDNRYRAVAESLDPPTGVAEADTLLEEVKRDLSQVGTLLAQQKDLSASSTRLGEEIARRKAAISSLGFDAPAAEADLLSNGLRPIQTSLVLKRDEVAALETEARLCRYRTRTQYVGGSQGISIPLGHGFRYRISGFKSTPVQVESLNTVDSGKLIVTNQRLVFLGAKRDVSTPISKLLQIEGFSNALGIGREGKETRDIYVVSNPAYVALYLQWVVSHQS
jgi:hypothetical protein